MTRLKKMHDMVKEILTNYPITRDDDRLVIGAVYALYYDVDMNTPFKEILLDKHLPNYETIRRCRQKVQADNEALRGKKDAERIDLQKEYVEYNNSDTKGGKI